MIESRESVLRFWFGEEKDDAAAARAQSSLWWGKSDKTDALIRDRFEALLPAAADEQLDWPRDTVGLLARILLLDQFPRNIYRGTPRAFAFDPAARALARDAVRSGGHRELRLIERVFVYLPFEHSEDAADQETSIALYSELVEDADDALTSTFADYLDYARRHKAIIDRFGRYPHRNEILGRASTPEEIEFLKTPGSGF